MMKLKASKKESQANPERARALARYGAYLSAARGDPEKARALFKKFSPKLAQHLDLIDKLVKAAK